MKKRFVCALLTLILLVSLVPAGALTAQAATLSVSETAITVLKQLEGYSQKCDSKGYIGYGTLCSGSGSHNGSHKIDEKKADSNLRTELKSLDSAVNSFASKQNLTLTQGKHDALVLFSFQNGTAWMSGTGEFRAAVVKGLRGSDFLNAICTWNADENDDVRRMIEANIYLYNVYSTSRPSKFIRVTFDATKELGRVKLPITDIPATDLKYDPVTGEVITEAPEKIIWLDSSISGEQSRSYYYDVSNKPAPHMVPAADGYIFTGWYVEGEMGYEKVNALTSAHHGKTLVAGWTLTTSTPENSLNVEYLIDKSQFLSNNLYVFQPEKPDGTTDYASAVVEEAKFVEAKDKKGKTIPASDYFCTETALWVDKDMVDQSGTRWCRVMGTDYWVKVSNKIPTTSASTSSDSSIDLTVSVVSNLGYVNRREKASIYSNKNGSYTAGTKLRIIDTASKDGFLWGKVAKDATGTDSVGWVALMYTDYETVRSQSGSVAVSNGKVIATGFITYKGYVNVRSDAGTDNEIVGALYNGTEFKLYQTKFVNGIEWGLCDSGWFCLTYANVNRSAATSSTTDVGFTSYAFTGTLKKRFNVAYDAPGGELLATRSFETEDVTITNLTNVDGITWGKIEDGWVKVTNSDGTAVDVQLDVAKFNVTSELTVRESASTSAKRIDTLTKGVEFNVNGTKQIMVVGDTVWGYADKVGEDKASYGGWVNLANKYVTRGDAPIVGATNAYAGKTATIVGAETVRVRGGASLSGKVLGSIKQGTTVNILGEENGWFKIDYNVGSTEYDSWVYGQYVEVKDGTVASGSSSAAASNGTGVGIIANTYGGVNVRATPGVGGTFKGKILPGTQVNILETKTVGSAQWGRVEQGWICMEYVQIISDLPADVLAALGTTTGTNGSSTTTGAEKAIYTGTVNQKVNVRKETSLDADIVRELEAGDNITLHEILEVVTVTEGDPTTKSDSTGSSTSTTTTKTTSYWARVNDGYIYNPAGHINLDTLDEATYTVTGSETLNVRRTAGTAGGETDILHRLKKGDQVKVTKLQIVNGNVWGYIEADPTDPVKTIDEEGNTVDSVEAWSGEGWISLAYTTKGAVAIATPKPEASTTTTPETKPVGSTGNTGTGGFVSNAGGYKYRGKVINTDSLNVRRTASTGATVDATLKRGASLVIYETCIAEGMAWGRCDAGWVYLYYVDMEADSLADVRVVYNDNTIAYTDVNCSEVAGTYSRMAVIEVYEIVGNMFRTDLGWVSKDNLLG